MGISFLAALLVTVMEPLIPAPCSSKAAGERWGLQNDLDMDLHDPALPLIVKP